MNLIFARGRKHFDMPKSFEFLFDFAGPNGYLTHKILPEFCARTGATATYVPVLLGGLMKATGNRPPWAVYADVPAKLAYDRLEFQRFIDTHGLTKFKLNPHFPANSITVMRGLIAAGRTGVFMPYVEAMMAAVWEEGLNIGDAAAVQARLNAAGLDGAGLLAMTGDPDVKAELTRNTEAAVARGAFGIPTFFVGDAMFFGKERLGQVAAALAG
jgi:2-hydroxychromene-2-carboxylate isomerase